MFQQILLVTTLVLVQIDPLSGNAIGNEILADKELMLAFAVHRHGDRAPDEDEYSLSNIKDKLKPFMKLYGLEGLTNAGRNRAYQIGKFFRKRYGSQGYQLVSNLYVPNEIELRSTDKDRTKMTALVSMAALYPPEEEQQWNDGIGKVWQPVPYDVVPLSEDYLRYYSNCKKYKMLMEAGKEDSILKEFRPYKDLIQKIKAETGRNFTENPLLFQALLDLFRSQEGFGLGISEWAIPIMQRLNEAARLAYMLYFRNEEMKKIGGGVLLNDFLVAASKIAQGGKVERRLRIFSAHDFNLGALMEVTGVAKENTIPDYGSVLALELFRCRSTGEYSVQPLYLPQAGTSSAEAYVFNGCENSTFCPLDQFKELTKNYVLPEAQFYQMCGIKTEL